MGSKSILGDIFGVDGLAKTVVKVLQGTGLLKDPEQTRLATEALYRFQSEMADRESKVIESINATMREEAKSEHFIQYSWRPLIGYTFAAVVINNFVVLTWFKVPPILIPDSIWSAMLVILGVSAGFRGLEKWQKTKNGNNK